MNTNKTSRVRIIKHQVPNVAPLVVQPTPELDNSSFASFLKKISRLGKYPEKHWRNLDSQDLETFNRIVDNLIQENYDQVVKGDNNEVRKAHFESVHSPSFNIDIWHFSFFVTRQWSPGEEPHYREISILLDDGRDPKGDPRPYRQITLKDNNIYQNITFADWDIDDEDVGKKKHLWWQMKQFWDYISSRDGKIDFSS